MKDSNLKKYFLQNQDDVLSQLKNKNLALKKEYLELIHFLNEFEKKSYWLIIGKFHAYSKNNHVLLMLYDFSVLWEKAAKALRYTQRR